VTDIPAGVVKEGAKGSAMTSSALDAPETIHHFSSRYKMLHAN